MTRDSSYAALGVPELWRYDGRKFVVLRRTAAGRYEPVSKSGQFPDLPMEQFNRLVEIGLASNQPAAIAALVEWFKSQHRQP